jgi:hypothetical protein
MWCLMGAKWRPDWNIWRVDGHKPGFQIGSTDAGFGDEGGRSTGHEETLTPFNNFAGSWLAR